LEGALTHVIWFNNEIKELFLFVLESYLSSRLIGYLSKLNFGLNVTVNKGTVDFGPGRDGRKEKVLSVLAFSVKTDS